MIRLAGLFIPDEGGFALVGDADSHDIRSRSFGLRQRTLDHILGSGPNFQGIVLHPTWFRIDLLMFKLVAANWLSSMIKEHTAGTGRPLVNRRDVLGHG